MSRVGVAIVLLVSAVGLVAGGSAADENQGGEQTNTFFVRNHHDDVISPDQYYQMPIPRRGPGYPSVTGGYRVHHGHPVGGKPEGGCQMVPICRGQPSYEPPRKESHQHRIPPHHIGHKGGHVKPAKPVVYVPPSHEEPEGYENHEPHHHGHHEEPHQEVPHEHIGFPKGHKHHKGHKHRRPQPQPQFEVGGGEPQEGNQGEGHKSLRPHLQPRFEVGGGEPQEGNQGEGHLEAATKGIVKRVPRFGFGASNSESSFGGLGASSHEGKFQSAEGIRGSIVAGSKKGSGSHDEAEWDNVDGIRQHQTINRDKTIIKDRLRGVNDVDAFSHHRGQSENDRFSGEVSGLAAEGEAGRFVDASSKDKKFAALAGKNSEQSIGGSFEA